MKKLLWGVPLALMLAACGDNEEDAKEGKVAEDKETEVTQEAEEKEEVLVASADREWVVDDRLQEPTEETICEMCNMKVYTKDHEMGVFSAQAVKADGSLAFYDDIGCLLNAEYAHNETNEKFVRDYHTLNWFNVEEAFVVKTSLKSPMNWGYIFFKYEEDANKYIAENEGAQLTPLADIQTAARERYDEKMKNGNQQMMDMEHEGHMQNNAGMEAEHGTDQQ